MAGEKVRKLTKMMFTGLTMALCVAAFTPAAKTEAATLQESEPNDNPATADQLPLNTWITGASEEYGDQDWYQFTIPAGGLTEIEFGRTAENTSDCWWYVYLEDSNRHSLINFDTRSLDYKIGLAPGKYYLHVHHQSRYGSSITYNLRINYTKSDSWEQERYYGSKTPGNANTAYVNKLYTGKRYCSDDVDWYRFKLTGNNKISLRFTIDDSVSNPGWWRIELQEYGSRKVLGSYEVNSNETLTVNKCSGDLLVKVGGYSSCVDQIYHLQLTSKSLTTASKKDPAVTTVKKPSATKITSIKAGKRSATVYWKKAGNANYYYIYRSTSKNGTYKKVATVTGKTSYTDKKSLKSKKNYYYKVVSVNKSGSKVLKSKASAYKRVKIK